MLAIVSSFVFFSHFSSMASGDVCSYCSRQGSGRCGEGNSNVYVNWDRVCGNREVGSQSLVVNGHGVCGGGLCGGVDQLFHYWDVSGVVVYDITELLADGVVAADAVGAVVAGECVV